MTDAEKLEKIREIVGDPEKDHYGGAYDIASEIAAVLDEP